MATIHHPDIRTIPLSAVLAALSDPTRLEIVRSLAKKACTCGSLDIEASKSALSHHVKVLRQAGVIHQKAEGTSRVTTLRREELDARFPGLLDSVLRAKGPI
ncbi:MAG: helix-turn-helix transcriptional regulator [Phycisphaeraceae bacterium]|nr:MAG: helix-turn-helix transcriptional regulator [Phycisphaeraceae bacterium]